MLYMQREYTAVIKKSGKWFIAWIEEVPGVNTQGRTMKEVRENLKEALALVLEENRKLSALEWDDAKRESIRVSLPDLAKA